MDRANLWESQIETTFSKHQSPVQWVLSLTTAPLLLALVAGRTTAQLLLQLGEQSEELFRGERLPLLPFPVVLDSQSPLLRPRSSA